MLRSETSVDAAVSKQRINKGTQAAITIVQLDQDGSPNSPGQGEFSSRSPSVRACQEAIIVHGRHCLEGAPRPQRALIRQFPVRWTRTQWTRTR